MAGPTGGNRSDGHGESADRLSKRFKVEAVRTIIETRWQLRRATLVDSELFQIYGNYKGQDRGVGTTFAQDATQGSAFPKLTKYQTFLLKKLRLAEQDLGRLKAESAKVLSHSQPALVLNTPATENNGAQNKALPPATP